VCPKIASRKMGRPYSRPFSSKLYCGYFWTDPIHSLNPNLPNPWLDWPHSSWACGSSPHGTASAILYYHKVSIVLTFPSEDGRMIEAMISNGQSSLNVVLMYAPAQKASQQEWYASQLIPEALQFDSIDILAGDFN